MADKASQMSASGQQKAGRHGQYCVRAAPDDNGYEHRACHRIPGAESWHPEPVGDAITYAQNEYGAPPGSRREDDRQPLAPAKAQSGSELFHKIKTIRQINIRKKPECEKFFLVLSHLSAF